MIVENFHGEQVANESRLQIWLKFLLTKISGSIL